MTPFNIRKEDLDMLKRKIDRYLADWSNEQDRNLDLNIACRKKPRVCHKPMTHPRFYNANYFFLLSASSGIGQFSDGVRISFITLSKPITISGYFLARSCFSSGSSRRL